MEAILKAVKDMMTKRYPQNSIMPKATEDLMYKDPKVETGLSNDCDALAVSLRANTYLEPHCSELGISNANIFTLPLGQPAAPELAQIFYVPVFEFASFLMGECANTTHASRMAAGDGAAPRRRGVRPPGEPSGRELHPGGMCCPCPLPSLA